MLESLCVYCGAKSGSNPVYATVAAELGRALAQQGTRLVYGGGNVGLMGVIADAVLEQGGQVTGVIPEALVSRELAHVRVLDMRIVRSMHARKSLMAELSQGFVALPGGLGTYEELFEMLTWGQLGFHEKPVALLNVNRFYDPLLMMLDRAVEDGFLSAANRRRLFMATAVSELMDHFGRHAEHSSSGSLS